VAAERVERRATPPFRASVYHLVERGRSAAYREAIVGGPERAPQAPRGGSGRLGEAAAPLGDSDRPPR
jgi:hypothetical protein